MVIRWVFLVALGELPAMSELSLTSLVSKQIHMSPFAIHVNLQCCSTGCIVSVKDLSAFPLNPLVFRGL